VYEVSSCITEKKIRRHYKIGKLAMFKELIGVYCEKSGKKEMTQIENK